MDNYFYQQEADLFTFYRIPKELVTNKKYKHISSDAKLLYGLLLDRNSLSTKNNWIDDKGRVFLYYSRELIIEELNISENTVTKLFKQLKEIDIIDEIRQGLGMPNKIYVKKFICIDGSQNRKTCGSESAEKKEQKSQNLRASYTDISYTDLNDTKISSTTHVPDIKIGNKKQNHVVVETFSDNIISLKSKITNTISATISTSQVDKLVSECGEEQINKVLENWDSIKKTTNIKNVQGYFIKLVREYIEPVTNKADATAKQQYNFNNNQKPLNKIFDERTAEEVIGEDESQFYSNFK
jgi:hypothetical protein